MIDLRKAFDVVDHNLLLKKLQIYGLNSKSLKWFGSYLSGRYQKVCVDGKLSEPLGIQSGVPQGSILGPALFLLFINDLPLVLKNSIGIYADDSTLYASAPTLADIEEKIRKSLMEEHPNTLLQAWTPFVLSIIILQELKHHTVYRNQELKQ